MWHEHKALLLKLEEFKFKMREITFFSVEEMRIFTGYLSLLITTQHCMTNVKDQIIHSCTIASVKFTYERHLILDFWFTCYIYSSSYSTTTYKTGNLYKICEVIWVYTLIHLYAIFSPLQYLVGIGLIAFTLHICPLFLFLPLLPLPALSFLSPTPPYSLTTEMLQGHNSKNQVCEDTENWNL